MEVRERSSRHMVAVPLFGREDNYRLDGLGTKSFWMRWKGIILGIYNIQKKIKKKSEN